MNKKIKILFILMLSTFYVSDAMASSEVGLGVGIGATKPEIKGSSLEGGQNQMLRLWWAYTEPFFDFKQMIWGTQINGFVGQSQFKESDQEKWIPLTLTRDANLKFGSELYGATIGPKIEAKFLSSRIQVFLNPAIGFGFTKLRASMTVPQQLSENFDVRSSGMVYQGILGTKLRLTQRLNVALSLEYLQHQGKEELGKVGVNKQQKLNLSSPKERSTESIDLKNYFGNRLVQQQLNVGIGINLEI